MLNDFLAGLICGLAMGTVFLGVFVYFVSSHKDFEVRLAERLPPALSPAVFMLLIVISIPPAWGVFGAIAGILYNVAEDFYPDDGLGSSNFTFTLAIIILALIMASIVLVLRKRIPWRLGLGVVLTLACLFGWLMPLLAHWR